MPAQVDAKPLKAELSPVVAAAQERVKLVLLALARDATLAALEDLQARVAALAQRPPALDGFMAYLVRGGVAVATAAGLRKSRLLSAFVWVLGFGSRSGMAQDGAISPCTAGMLVFTWGPLIAGSRRTQGSTCGPRANAPLPLRFPWLYDKAPPRSPPPPQKAMHSQQVEDRKQLVAACGQVDDMYDSLAAHEQKV